MFGREKEKWWEEMESIRVGGRGLFRGFLWLAGLIDSRNSFSFFSAFFVFACTPKILVQLLGNTVASFLFLFFWVKGNNVANRVSLSFGFSTSFFFPFYFILFNGDQIEVSLFPFFFIIPLLGERKFETRECPLNYKHKFK